MSQMKKEKELTPFYKQSLYGFYSSYNTFVQFLYAS